MSTRSLTRSDSLFIRFSDLLFVRTDIPRIVTDIHHGSFLAHCFLFCYAVTGYLVAAHTIVPYAMCVSLDTVALLLPYYRIDCIFAKCTSFRFARWNCVRTKCTSQALATGIDGDTGGSGGPETWGISCGFDWAMSGWSPELVLAFFFFLSKPTVTALLTESTISRLCSMYSLSSNRCFFPARGGGTPLAEDDDDDGSSGEAEGGAIPSCFSSFSSLSFAASAAARLRAGSFSRYSANFLASLRVLSRLPERSRQESLLLVFWLLMRPPAARSWEPKPPLPPRRRGVRRSVISGEDGHWREERRVEGASGG